MATKAKPTETYSIPQLQRSTAEFFILGESGLYFNSMAAKAMRDLLAPTKKATVSERSMRPKHQPRIEFESSVYRITHQKSPTMLGFPASGFKGAMATAALATAGINKTDVQKHLYVKGELIPIFGDPFLRMDVVRSADMNKTPDVRTRAFMPEWAARVTISFTMPNFTAEGVANLLSNAGQIAGIGDFRQEKGRGNFGRWKLTGQTDKEYVRITELYNSKTQEDAIKAARPWDDMTDELLQYWDEQYESRGFDQIAAE